MMDKVKKFFIGWMLQGKMVEVLKKLDGYKTYLGVVLSVLQGYVLYQKPGGTIETAATAGIDALVAAGNQAAVAPEEMQMLFANLLLAWGIIAKIIKFIRGK